MRVIRADDSLPEVIFADAKLEGESWLIPSKCSNLKSTYQLDNRKRLELARAAWQAVEFVEKLSQGCRSRVRLLFCW